jgi:hypothetical protein
VPGRQQKRIAAVVLGFDALGGPAGGASVGIAGLVQQRVQRVVGAERHHRGGVVPEGGRSEIKLQQLMQPIRATVRAEQGAAKL